MQQSHIQKPMTFLISAWSATYMLSHLWECVRDNKIENAMTAQFLYLFHRDEANEALVSMNQDELETLNEMANIADGVPQ